MPVVSGYPIQVPVSGAGRRASTGSRLPAVWPPRSTSTSMPSSRTSRASASSSSAATSRQRSQAAAVRADTASGRATLA